MAATTTRSNSGIHVTNASSNRGILNSTTNHSSPTTKTTTTTTSAAANIPVVRLAPCCQLTAKATAAAYKKSSKLDPRLRPSPLRQLLPIALCILSFALVLTMLILYMDTTGKQKKSILATSKPDLQLTKNTLTKIPPGHTKNTKRCKMFIFYFSKEIYTKINKDSQSYWAR